jgi:hypothetical protein
MTQVDLEHEVAAKMGESVSTIRRHGFSLVTPLMVFDAEANDVPCRTVDWDRLEADRYARVA